jgi:non-specific serine/threonine protein kinase/serine/threonine-protein kinase
VIDHFPRPDSGGPLSDLGVRLELFARVCDAIQYAHQQGVVHRDLKPDNILVVDESAQRDDSASRAPGSDGHGLALPTGELGTSARARRSSSLITHHSSLSAQPKILDFGVARLIESDVQLTTVHTDVGQLVGTLPYMSPEQVGSDPAQVDTRSDVYSAGVLLYELLTGRLPYDVRRVDIAHAARVITEQAPAPISGYHRALRGDIDTIVRKALEKDKRRRYQSAAELASDIRRCLAGQPILARQDSHWYVLRKSLRRYRAAVAVVAGFFVVVSAALVVSLAALHQARIDRQRATREQARAEQRFSQVRELANKFLFDFHDRIRGLPGATPARKFVVETGLQYLDSLIADAEGDPTLQAELADAYRKIGDVQGWPGLPNLGDTEGALRSYERAAGIVDRLRAADPADAQLHHRALQIRQRRADLAMHSAHDAEARAEYRAIIDAYSELLREQPDNTVFHEARIVASMNLVSSMHGSTAFEQRAAVLQQTRERIEEYLEQYGDDPRVRLHLARCVNKLGRVYFAPGSQHRNDPDRAVECFHESLAILDQLSGRSEMATEVALSGIAALNGVAEVQLARRDLDAALETFRRSVGEAERGMRLDPLDRRAADALTITLDSMADVYLERKDSAAIPILERCFSLREEFYQRDPANTANYPRIGVAAERLGRAYAQAGRIDDCKRMYDRAVSIWWELSHERRNPLAPITLTNVVAGYHRYAATLEAAQNIAGAIEVHRRACGLFDTPEASDVEPLTLIVTTSVALADALVRAAEREDTPVEQRLALYEEAAERYQRGLESNVAAAQSRTEHSGPPVDVEQITRRQKRCKAAIEDLRSLAAEPGRDVVRE